ncbi:choice-of-anchor M domain-containing protein [Gulosibacter sp. 10]|uniref:choice-of-anchor M domain-containing protein n=1 Tax=Gulosibacter sp. 10 TaxID=1255570 RepID=UPI00097EC71F|nr:choice-of-anchor M domain-containing protein [Gulosibacter sp. 10]SJM68167.1 hypothetical protein FM112_13195 [Gulosibacter sp. 10]
MRALKRIGRTAAASLLALSALAAAPLTATAATDEDGEEDGLNQIIDPNQQQGEGQVVIDAGHLDFGPTLNTGEWRLQIHDDSGSPSYWRMPEDVVMQVSDAALLEVPDDEAYSFMGVEPGAQVHVVPQTQHPDVVWTGWNTQEPGVMEQVDLGVTMSLVGFEGPGEMTLFLQSGNFGAPEVLYSTQEALPQQSWIEVNTHTHANWVFTEPGIYLVEMQLEADLRDGTHVVAHDTLRFSVGDGTNPEEAFDAQLDEAAIVDADTAEAADGGQNDAAQPEGSVPGVVWIVAIVIGAALVLGVVIVVIANVRMRRKVRRARERKAAEKDADAESEHDGKDAE